MSPIQGLAALALFALFGAIELHRGRFFDPAATREDKILDLVVFNVFPLAIIPAIFTLTFWVGTRYFPQAQDAWAQWPWWQMLLVLLLADDLTQYWWHRLSHSSWMWPFHRAHHSAGYMGVRVVYRNNFFYYAAMPGLWLSSILVFLGFGWVYVGYSIVKLAIIIGAHSEARWDEALFRCRWLHPLLWVLERTISTPCTHYAHHALRQDDGIGYYRGNYGNLLFLWDVLFGTALITRRYPPAFGLPDDRRHGSERWQVQFFYPLFRSQRAETVYGDRPGRAPED
ncbi:MAG: fatty acid hydroxylase family protein [Nevskiaceae bacterium]|nr:MAG: fatty acid hydroxylase family protein [Nevskiaceae bacterium]